MSNAFSSDDDVTKKQIDTVSRTATEKSQLNDAYELNRCREWITENRFSKVALQFPDDLLVDSVPVQNCLQEQAAAGTTILILGDTSYGSCCVDEVAAEHYQADSIIHFGSACLSPTHRLPVLYIFCRQPVDVTHAAEQVQTVLTDSPPSLIIMADAVYQHVVETLAEQLRAQKFSVIASSLQLPPPSSTDSTSENTALKDCESGKAVSSCDTETVSPRSLCMCSRQFVLPQGSSVEDYGVLFIGEEGRLLTNLMMTMNRCKFWSYSPETRCARQETLSVNRALMKRFYMVERAKEARIVGIAAGTLGVSRTREIIAHLKALLTAAGKKSYTLVVGKLNVPKLANFMEVDVFVLVACPLNTLIDSKDFLKPVVTPFELEVACNQAREWTGDYITDFQRLLPGAADYMPSVAPAADTADISLISNRLVSVGVKSDVEVGEGSSAVMLRSDAMALASVGADTAGEYLSQRSWQGLDPQLGQTPVEKARDGRSGIAMGYHNEPQ